VGLGAFTSVVTRGGLSLAREGVPITTGNSYTAVASAGAISTALERLGDGPGGQRTAAVVGATGAIGRALSLLLADQVGRLVLLGNPERLADAVRRRLLSVAGGVCRHLAARRREGRRCLPGTLGDCPLVGGLAADAGEEAVAAVVAAWERAGRLVLSQDLAAELPGAGVVVTATSATGSIVRPADLRHGAVVCDLSRPANVSRAVAGARPDVLVLDGGIIAVPGRPFLARFGLDVGLCYACMAETMLLALDGHFHNTSLGTDLSAETLRQLQASAERHGFRVARLRSFGRALGEPDWAGVLAARRGASCAVDLPLARGTARESRPTGETARESRPTVGRLS
jgi:predicted amino acid dehydrogenase